MAKIHLASVYGESEVEVGVADDLVVPCILGNNTVVELENQKKCLAVTRSQAKALLDAIPEEDDVEAEVLDDGKERELVGNEFISPTPYELSKELNSGTMGSLKFNNNNNHKVSNDDYNNHLVTNNTNINQKDIYKILDVTRPELVTLQK